MDMEEYLLQQKAAYPDQTFEEIGRHLDTIIPATDRGRIAREATTGVVSNEKISVGPEQPEEEEAPKPKSREWWSRYHAMRDETEAQLGRDLTSEETKALMNEVPMDE
jgi:hypothetical protein